MFINRGKIFEDFEKLYGKQDSQNRYREFVNKNKWLFLIFISATIIAVSISVYYNYQVYNEGISRIERNDYGKGSKSISLTAQIADYPEEEINVVVEAIKYTDDELEEFAGKFEEEIFKKILGKNANLDQVTTDLNLMSYLDNYPFTISWKTEKPFLINNKGEMDLARVKKELEDNNAEGIPVSLCATVRYGNYTKDFYACAVIRKKQQNTYEDIVAALQEKIMLYGERDSSLLYQELPRDINGIPVKFRIKKSGESIVIAIMGIFLSFGLVIGQKKDIEKKIKLREKELENDYPNILNQYVLYYCAGMNSRVIWAKICDHYESDLKKGGKKRYAYEEMIVTRREIMDGMGELTAYEGFAKRCSNQRYRTFVSLIEQSLVTGRENLDILLKEELDKARRDEINRVRMSAQEMSTKLLFPMIMMLGVVIVIVMVPAFISFGN